MYRISKETKKYLEHSLGMSLAAFSAMSAEEEKQWANRRNKEKIVYAKCKRQGIIGRGNPLLARRKVRTIEDISRKSRELFGV